MLSLTLENPVNPHLEYNARAPIHKMFMSLDSIREACTVFTAENDNRKAIASLYEELGKHVEALTDVQDRDEAKIARGAAYSRAHNRYVSALPQLAQRLTYLNTGEEGTKLIRRKMQQAHGNLKTALDGFSESNDTRPAARAAITKMLTHADELLLIDLTLDRWYGKQLRDAGELLLRVIDEPIEWTEPEPVQIGALNLKHLAAKDAARDLVQRVNSIGYSYWKSLDEVQPLSVKAQAIYQALSGDMFAPLGNVTGVAIDIRALSVDIARLQDVRIPEGGNPTLLRSTVTLATGTATKLLDIIEPRQSLTLATVGVPSLMQQMLSKVTTRFAWEG